MKTCRHHNPGLLPVAGMLLLLAYVGLHPAAAQQAQSTSPHGEWVTTVICSDCHTADAWTPLRQNPLFDHSLDGGFELIAAHAVTACASCHENLAFSPPKLEPRECADCHVDVHAGNLVQSCDTCHNSRSFLEVDGWAIHERTVFPLLGAHEVIACERCHTDDFGGAFMQNETACVSCHEAEYLATTVIPHAEKGFSLACESCHTQHIWEDAIFPDHALVANGFELIGAHDFAGCESCHVQPSFDLVFTAADQNDCIACHQPDYYSEHGGSGFPTTCLDCHNQSSWDDASEFDHDGPYFPIFSGSHKGEWDNCSDCHQAAPVMTTFTCLSCHEHNQPEMDREHDDIRNYVYDSRSCLSCHPDGREDDD